MGKEILIVGAGRSGLSMAIFLSELGYRPKVVDKKPDISEYSKALAVNPRTLEIFEAFGVTDRFLANGRKMEAINLWKADEHIYKNDFTKVESKYPFMLIQPQRESEEILLEEALRRNIEIEYNSEFLELKKTNDKYSTILRGHTQKTEEYDYVIGADGGSSEVRKQLEIDYEGFRYDENWELFDIELDIALDADEGHIRVFPEGGIIMIRLRDNIWRLAGNMKSILNYLPRTTKIGKVHWESEFRIHHKVATTLTIDHAILIGDAAHLHSPVGARGMNLGIEDAFIASRLLKEGKISEYDNLRRPYIQKTVGRINNITMGLAGNNRSAEIVRRHLGNMRMLFPIIMPRVTKFVLGLS